jgi:hypothetical protein
MQASRSHVHAGTNANTTTTTTATATADVTRNVYVVRRESGMYRDGEGFQNNREKPMHTAEKSSRSRSTSEEHTESKNEVRPIAVC